LAYYIYYTNINFYVISITNTTKFGILESKLVVGFGLPILKLDQIDFRKI